MVMLIENLSEHLNYLKKKDEIAIQKAQRRFESGTQFSMKFSKKVYDIYEAFKLQGPYIAAVLKEFIDNPLGEVLFGTPFSHALVCSVLMDTQFTAMLMCNNMLRRTANLARDSEGQLKLRVYIAILNYDRYKKKKSSRR